MSEQVEAKADDTAAAEDQGQETALSAAEAAEAAQDGAEGSEAIETKGEGTALSQAGENGDGADGAEGDGADGDESGDGEGAEGDGEEGDGKDGEESEGSVVEQALSEVEMPEGFTVSDEDKAAVGKLAETHKLGKDAVKDLIALQTQRETARLEQVKKTQTEFIGKMKTEALKLPKETLVGANRFVQKYGSDSLKAKMSDPGYYIGNDVDIINAFATAQKAVDGGFVDGGSAGGGASKSAGEVLYE